MISRSLVALPVAMAILAAGPFSQAAAIAERAGARPADPVSSSAPQTRLVLRGTIKRYDSSSKVLTVSTANGTVTFAMAAGVRVRQGWHHLDPSALEALSGYRVAVRYSESGEVKTVDSVRVSRKDDKSQ